MKPTDVQALLGEMRQALRPHYGPALEEKFAEAGLEGPQWFLLAVSNDFEPETTAAARFSARGPYASSRVFEKGLAQLAEKGLLEAAGPDEYRITGAGHAALKDVMDMFSARLDKLEPVPGADLERLAALLFRLVNASLAAPEPPDKSSLTYNRHSDPGPDGTVLLRIVQYMADLNSFRDDSHLAAWRPHGVGGPAWEAFTFLWRDEAHSAKELVEKLPNREISADDYTDALQELVERGWAEVVDETKGTYQLTGQGKALRQEAEEATDRYYYAPWDCFSQDETEELGSLLTRLRDSL
jgi:DNA-binding PadR family transcriptional regulator